MRSKISWIQPAKYLKSSFPIAHAWPLAKWNENAGYEAAGKRFPPSVEGGWQ